MIIEPEHWLKIILPLAAIFVPFAGGLILWALNQRSKLLWEIRLKKEERYKAFLDTIHGFYVSSQDQEAKNRFLREMRLAWLYCPDDIIRSGHAFLDTIATGQVSSDKAKEHALAEFELSLRRDILGKTTLTIKDHRILTST